MHVGIFEPLCLLGASEDRQCSHLKIDQQIEQIEKRPRKRVDIFLLQQRTKENSFRVDVLNDKDPHYTILYANLPISLVHSFVTLDMDCSHFILAQVGSFLEAIFTCLHPSLCKLPSDQKTDFLKHASHIINPSRKLNSLDAKQMWFAHVESYFKVKIWLLDTHSNRLMKSSKPYIADNALNIVLVQSSGEWFSLLQHIDKEQVGVLSSKQFKNVFTNMCESLALANV